MATAADPSAKGSGRIRRKISPFFPAMAIFAIAIAGFAFVPEYVEHAAGRFPIAWVLHIHGAVMAAWLGLFLMQAYLGATGRLARHRSLGNIAFAIGWLAWASMIFVEWRSYVVKPPPVDPGAYDWLLPGPYVYLTFPLFLAWGYRNRKRPEWHKRLVLFALFLSLTAAVERFLWIPWRFGFWPFAAFLDVSLLLPLVLYDLRALRGKIHPATIRGGALLFGAQAALFCLWGTESWRRFAIAATRSARALYLR